MKWLFLTVTFLFWAAQAQAQGTFPALFTVTGVTTGDVLNIRSGPGARHDILGGFAPGQSGIEVIGTTQDGRWGRIGAGEISGWVSMRFLTRTGPDYNAGLPTPLHCFGTEPFWSFTRAPGGGVFEAITLSAPESYVELWSGIPAGRPPIAFGLELESGTSRITGFVRTAICNDGMSDRDFGFSAYFLRNASGEAPQLLEGCCTLSR